jgi:hypothetical protein
LIDCDGSISGSKKWITDSFNFSELVNSVSFWSVAFWHVARRSFPDEPDHRYDDQENRADGHQAELDLGQQGGNLRQPINPVGIH